ncbi:hypothetical protein ZWY2020_058392 [Hordeum vulgare]|nr:hypothetical protein ZWY2020_058392 [Hordeum vulgare]
MGSPPISNVGGRFWALSNDEELSDDDEVQTTAAASPTPYELVCESILAGYSVDQVAKRIDGLVPHSDDAWNGLGDNEEDKIEVVRRVVHRCTSHNAV